MNKKIAASIEHSLRPFTAHEAALLARKLSRDYAKVYTGRIAQSSWKRLASEVGTTTYHVRKMFREAHTDLVKLTSWNAACSRGSKLEAA